MFRNDEAFERFEMGGDQPHEKGSKGRNQAEADYLSVKHSEYNLALRASSCFYDIYAL